MSKKLIVEMSQILGRPGDGPVAVYDPNPREVVGTFMIKQDVNVMDEAMLESVSGLGWDDIFDIAVISTMNPNDFQTLNRSMDEGTRSFRESWTTMISDNVIDSDYKRGAFVFLSKVCPTTESRAKYVQWCTRVVEEAGSKTKAAAAKRSSKFKMIIPIGTMDQHKKNTDAAAGANRIVDLNDDSVMKNAIHKDGPAPKPAVSAASVDSLEKKLMKLSLKTGGRPEEKLLNVRIDLDRDRIKGE